jgi:hypothetical protein
VTKYFERGRKRAKIAGKRQTEKEAAISEAIERHKAEREEELEAARGELGALGNPTYRLVVTAPTESRAKAKARKFGPILSVAPAGADTWHVVVRQNPEPKKWLSAAIRRKGKLGGKGFLSKSRAEQKRILDRCVDEYGYRSCLGSVMVLERIPATQAKHGRTLATLRRYLGKTYGGSGSFAAPRRRRALANPGEFTFVPEISGCPECTLVTNPAFEAEMDG